MRVTKEPAAWPFPIFEVVTNSNFGRSPPRPTIEVGKALKLPCGRVLIALRGGDWVEVDPRHMKDTYTSRASALARCRKIIADYTESAMSGLRVPAKKNSRRAA